MTTSQPHGDSEFQNLPAIPQRVLVADDEHLAAAGIIGLLHDLGYETAGPANSGDSPVALARSDSPDVALLDIRMPEAEGLEAAETIYNEMGIPVIMVSAYSDPDYIATSQRIGVFGYLLKPVTGDQLRIGIEIAWSRFLKHLDLTNQVDNLHDRLEERKVMEQAKWIVVKRKDVPEPEAMRMLQKQARNGRKPIIEVAQAIIDSESLLGD